MGDYRRSIEQPYFKENPNSLRRIMFKSVLQSRDDTICFREQIISFWFQVGRCLTNILKKPEFHYSLVKRIDKALNTDRGYNGNKWTNLMESQNPKFLKR